MARKVMVRQIPFCCLNGSTSRILARVAALGNVCLSSGKEVERFGCNGFNGGHQISFFSPAACCGLSCVYYRTLRRAFTITMSSQVRDRVTQVTPD
jgi:hypothetical protein